MALAHGIDLARVEGTGPNGRVTRTDIARLIDLTPPGGAAVADSAGARERDRSADIARPGAGSGANDAVAPRDPGIRGSDPRRCRADHGFRAVLKADAADRFRQSTTSSSSRGSARIAEQPVPTASIREDGWELYDRVNIGIAVATDDGLVVADDLRRGPKTDRRDRAHDAGAGQRARARAVIPGRTRRRDVHGLESRHVRHRQLHALSSHPIRPRSSPWALRSTSPSCATARWCPGVVVLHLALCSDHRILYGADAAMLLQRIQRFLERPYALLI